MRDLLTRTGCRNRTDFLAFLAAYALLAYLGWLLVWPA